MCQYLYSLLYCDTEKLFQPHYAKVGVTGIQHTCTLYGLGQNIMGAEHTVLAVVSLEALHHLYLVRCQTEVHAELCRSLLIQLHSQRQK